MSVPPHPRFQAWWEGRSKTSPELEKLEAMAKLMGLSVKAWCELAWFDGIEEAALRRPNGPAIDVDAPSVGDV